MTILLALLAQTAAPVCTKVADPPAALAAWAKPADGKTLRPGTAIDLPMEDVAGLRFPVAPARAPVGGTYGAVVPFAIATAGTYSIALSEAAWLDVARGPRLLTSIGHRHGPPCTGIRKIVDFRLTPGRYTLQLIGAPRPEGKVLLVRR